MRVVRGMIGTGLTFAAGVGVVGGALGLIARMAGQVTLREVFELVGKTSVVAFIVGVAFAGILALTARGRSFDKLSLRFVTALGSGVGLLYFLAISINGVRAWTPADAIANFAVLTVLGGVSAAAMLLIARKAGRALRPGDEVRSLGEGAMESPLVQRGATKQTSRL